MANTVQHSTSREALESVRKFLLQADQQGKWLAAVWQVTKEGKIELVGRTTYDFPRGDFLAAIGHLALNLFEESKLSSALPSTPLPEFKLFGADDLPPTVQGGNVFLQKLAAKEVEEANEKLQEIATETQEENDEDPFGDAEDTPLNSEEADPFA